MNFKLFKAALFSASVITVLASCNKVEQVQQQYMRCGNSLAIAADGNLIVAGYNSSTTKGYQASLIKVDAASGDTTWSRNFGSSYSDVFYSVKKSNEGGFIAAGFSNKASTGSPAMFVVITDALGTEVKSGTYGGSSYSEAFSVVPNADSGYLVAGYIQKTGTSDRDIYLVRINNAGAVIWEKSLGAKSNNPNDTVFDAAYGVIAAPGGGYFVTGSLNGYSSCCGRIFLMKVSAAGDSLWTKTYGFGIGFSLALTHTGGVADGGVAISGTLQEGTSQDIFLIKTDTAGNRLWPALKSFGGSGYEYGASMVETSAGGFAITGITSSIGLGSQDVYLIRTDASGGKIGEYTYGGTDVDQGFGIVQMSDGGFAITGLSNSGGSYIFLNRVKEDGTQYWPKPVYIK